MKLTTILVCLLCSGVPLWAGFQGPASANSVRAVLDNPVDEAYVAIEGYIVRRMSEDLYTFEDSTGEIQVEIEEDDFPSRSIDPKTRVLIQGEVDKNFFREPLIEVDKIEVLN